MGGGRVASMGSALAPRALEPSPRPLTPRTPQAPLSSSSSSLTTTSPTPPLPPPPLSPPNVISARPQETPFEVFVPNLGKFRPLPKAPCAPPLPSHTLPPENSRYHIGPRPPPPDAVFCSKYGTLVPSGYFVPCVWEQALSSGDLERLLDCYNLLHGPSPYNGSRPGSSSGPLLLVPSAVLPAIAPDGLLHVPILSNGESANMRAKNLRNPEPRLLCLPRKPPAYFIRGIPAAPILTTSPELARSAPWLLSLPLPTQAFAHLARTGQVAARQARAGVARSVLRSLKSASQTNYANGYINEISFSESQIAYCATPSDSDERYLPNSMFVVTRTNLNHHTNVPLHFSSPANEQRTFKTISDVVLYGDTAITSGHDKMVSFSRLGVPFYTFKEHTSNVERLAQCRSDPSIIASGAENGRIFLHHVTQFGHIDEAIIEMKEAPASGVKDLKFGTGVSENLLISANGHSTLSPTRFAAWNLQGNCTVKMPILESWHRSEDLSAISLSLCGRSLAFGCSFSDSPRNSVRKVGVVAMNTQKIVTELPTDQEDVNDIGFSDCGTFLFSAATNNTCVVFDLRQPSIAHTVIWHGKKLPSNTDRNGVANARWLCNSSLLATGGDDGKICFWDLFGRHCGKQRYHTINDPGSRPVSRFRFDETETLLATANEHWLTIYSAGGGETLF